MSANRLTRREFFQGAAVASAAVTATGVLGAASVAAAAPAPDKWDKETDVLVVGGGVGGLMAALRAAQAGAKVIVIEAAPETGGTALISGGGIHKWNLTTYDQVKAAYPDSADLELAKVEIDTWPTVSKFVRETLKAPTRPVDIRPYLPNKDVPLSGLDFYMGDKAGYAGVRAYCDFFNKQITELGGNILLQTKGVKLYQDASDRVIGARAVTADGKTMDIKANATILACGGFQANPELLVRYFGKWADNAMVRASPYNDGAGMLMAVAAGAKLSKGFGSGYGHQQPVPFILPTSVSGIFNVRDEYDRTDKSKFNLLFSVVQPFDHLCIDVNLNGERFFDEGFGETVQYYNNVNNYATLYQPYARGFRIFDSQTATDARKVFLNRITDNGGIVVTGNTIEELITNLNASLSPLHQIPAARLKKTIEEYNAAVAAGREALENLNPPRTGISARAINQPPFYALQYTAGFSCMYGGVAITKDCQVLAAGSNAPIAGLYAIPGTAGGACYEGYMGSLAMISVFGYIAGDAAGKSVKASL